MSYWWWNIKNRFSKTKFWTQLFDVAHFNRLPCNTQRWASMVKGSVRMTLLSMLLTQWVNLENEHYCCWLSWINDHDIYWDNSHNEMSRGNWHCKIKYSKVLMLDSIAIEQGGWGEPVSVDFNHGLNYTKLTLT